MKSKPKVRPVASAASRRSRELWLMAALSTGLAALIWIVFGQTRSHPFSGFDDNQYIYQNEFVMRGLTWPGFGWAMCFGGIGHWHPLTWLSHMMDCELFGLRPGGHHVVNVLWHTGAAVLLLYALRRMTGSLWRSAFVAAVFAVHPLRVESVAWIAERKDVMAAFFFMLTLLMYLRHAERPSRGRYLCVVGAFTLGLLSKNMLVTMPFVLLLLDGWPLKRVSSFEFRVLSWWPLIREKIPLFLLSLGSCAVTLLVPEELSGTPLPLSVRLENAVVSYAIYLRQTFWPTDLACLYPNPTGPLAVASVMLAVVLLAVISGLAIRWSGRRPYWFVGWFWFVGMLVPVIGLVQISSYAHADRYTYLPGIGLLVLLTWWAAELTGGWRRQKWVLSIAAVAVLGGLTLRARDQVRLWADDIVLWNHVVACTERNAIGESNLGTLYHQAGNLPEAFRHLRKAVEYDPANASARYNLGSGLSEAGQLEEAIEHLAKAVAIAPEPRSCLNLANACYRKGDRQKAASCYEQLVALQPDNPVARANLAGIFLELGRVAPAIAHYEQLLKLRPDNGPACERLAFIYAACPDAALRNGARAVELAQRADRLAGGKDPLVLRTLAAALAESGRFEDALQVIQRGLPLATVQANGDLVEELQAELQLYQSRKPLRDPGLTEAAGQGSGR